MMSLDIQLNKNNSYLDMSTNNRSNIPLEDIEKNVNSLMNTKNGESNIKGNLPFATKEQKVSQTNLVLKQMSTDCRDVTITINVSPKDTMPATRNVSCQTVDYVTIGSFQQTSLYCHRCNVTLQNLEKDSGCHVTSSSPNFYQKLSSLSSSYYCCDMKNSSCTSRRSPKESRSVSCENVSKQLYKILENETLKNDVLNELSITRFNSHDMLSSGRQSSVESTVPKSKLVEIKALAERRVASYPDVRNTHLSTSSTSTSSTDSLTNNNCNTRSTSQASDFNCLKTVDFNQWIKSARNGRLKTSIITHEAHDVAGFKNKTTLAATDARKVKINLIDNNEKVTFRAPTWPRCGRGITVSKDQRSLAVCHLTEVCIYDLNGKLKRRFDDDTFGSCWGITCDKKGNYAITESKHGIISIIDSRTGAIITRYSSTERKDRSKKGSRGEEIPWIEIFQNNPELEKIKLTAPRYIACNNKNQIIVTDTSERCVIAFDRDGSVIFRIGNPASTVPDQPDELQLIKEAASRRTRAMSMITFASESQKTSKIGKIGSMEDTLKWKRSMLFGNGGIKCKKLMKNLRRNTSNKSLTELLVMAGSSCSLVAMEISENNQQKSRNSSSEVKRKAEQKQSLKRAQSEVEEAIKVHDKNVPLDPRGICVDSHDNLLVVDKETVRLLVYSSNGDYIGTLLTKEHGLIEPRACCISGTNQLTLTDETDIIKTFTFF